MKKILLLALLSSCLHRGPRIELEQGIVVDKQFAQGYDYSYTTMMLIPDGKGSFIQVPQLNTGHVPPVYRVAFKCQHNRVFNIDRQDLYESLDRSDTVTIEYYNLLNGNDEIKDFDFVTAYKQKK